MTFFLARGAPHLSQRRGPTPGALGSGLLSQRRGPTPGALGSGLLSQRRGPTPSALGSGLSLARARRRSCAALPSGGPLQRGCRVGDPGASRWPLAQALIGPPSTESSPASSSQSTAARRCAPPPPSAHARPASPAR